MDLFIYYNTICKTVYFTIHSHVLFLMIYEGGDKCNKPFPYVVDA